MKDLNLDTTQLDKIKQETVNQQKHLQGKEGELADAKKSLEPLQRKLEELRKAVRGNEARASELETEAKKTSNVADIAQAKKEELWNQAKRAGEGADKQSDRGYLDATKAVGGDVDKAKTLTEKSEKTAAYSQKQGTETVSETTKAKEQHYVS